MLYPALGRALHQAPAVKGWSDWHPSSNPTCNCVFDIQGNKGSCRAREAWEGKGARQGASMVEHLNQDSSKQHLGRWKLHRLKLLEREHPCCLMRACCSAVSCVLVVVLWYCRAELLHIANARLQTIKLLYGVGLTQFLKGSLGHLAPGYSKQPHNARSLLTSNMALMARYIKDKTHISDHLSCQFWGD